MKAVVVLAHGFEEIEAVTPIDLLRRAGVSVTVAGLTTMSVVGARGLSVQCDALLESVSDDWDALVLPGGLPGARHLAESALVARCLQQTIDRGARIAAICAAPALVLGARGLLAGRSYTCYPGMESEVSDGRYLTEAVVVDGPLITSRGVGTAGAFALKLVETLLGPAKAAEVARSVLL